MIRWLRSLFRRRDSQREVELMRKLLMARIAERKAQHREWKPLLPALRQCTNASLAVDARRPELGMPFRGIR